MVIRLFHANQATKERNGSLPDRILEPFPQDAIPEKSARLNQQQDYCYFRLSCSSSLASTDHPR
jgi:hypothetical protein